jgi:hypothetical protein
MKIFVLLAVGLILIYVFYGSLCFVNLEKHHLPSKRVVVSFTTLPSRIKNAQKVIKSVLAGSIQPAKIYLNLPKISKRENDTYKVPKDIEEFVNVCEDDYGPITKLYPVLEKETDPDTVIICIDDDKEYSPYLLEHLLKSSEEFPDSCVCVSGWNYINIANLVALPIKFPIPNLAKQVEILQCYNGVLYKRSFFKDLSLLRKMMAVTKYRTVDDIIISMYLQRQNVPIVCVPGHVNNKSLSEDEYKDNYKLGKFNLQNNIWIGSLVYFKNFFIKN